MKQLVFALEFKGRAGPVAGAQGKLAARTSAPGQVWRTAFAAHKVEVAVETLGGGTATFESEVQITGDGTFLESGSISYGSIGKVTYNTMGQGILGPSEMEGLQRGAVIWQVTGGEGQLAGATGLITSNFTVGADGAVVDNHFTRLFLPE